MRHAGMAVLAAGVLVGAAAGVRGPGAGARPESLTPHRAAIFAVSKTKPVAYDGYVVEVPAGWPVYRLAAAPRRCVRYDTHAVYLGAPGPDQQCPAHLVGRTEAVRIDSAGTGRVAAAGAGALARDSAAHELRLTLAGTAGDRPAWVAATRQSLSITATYGDDPAMAERIVSSAHAATAPTSLVSLAVPASPGPAKARGAARAGGAARARQCEPCARGGGPMPLSAFTSAV